MRTFAERRALARVLTSNQKDAIHRVNEQQDDGIIRMVVGRTKSVYSESKMTLRAVLSSETKDRYDDIIRVQAYNTPQNFKDYFDGNPQLLWAHGRDSSVPNRPLGKVSNPSFDTKDTYGNKAFEGDVTFTDAYQFAIETWKLYEQDILRAFSVGFRPKVMNVECEDCEGIEFLDVALLENSAVPIPANPGALRKAFTTGLVSEEYLEQTFFKMRDEILVRNTDIFVPRDLGYRDSLNEMAVLASEIRSGHTVINIPKKEEKKLEDYSCGNCDKVSKVCYNDFPKKKLEGLDVEFNNVTCSSCGVTTEDSFRMALEFLATQKS